MNAQALDVLLDVELPVTVRLGATQVNFGDVAGFNTGSLVEFDRAPEEPIELLVNGRIVARGEMVMVQNSYGVRITEVASGCDKPDPVSEADAEVPGERSDAT
jgi:flagellar motor switch protein FliN